MDTIFDWILSSGLLILFIIIAAFLAFRISKAIIRPVVKNYVNSRGKGRHSIPPPRPQA